MPALANASSGKVMLIALSTANRTSATRPPCQHSATRGASVVAIVTATSAWGKT